MLQVEALADAAEFDVEVAADQLEGDFLAGVADGEVDLAEPALADAALDRVALQRAGAAGVEETLAPAAVASRPADRFSHPANRAFRSSRDRPRRRTGLPQLKFCKSMIKLPSPSGRATVLNVKWNVLRFQVSWSRSMALRMQSSFRIQATSATFFFFPSSNRCW